MLSKDCIHVPLASISPGSICLIIKYEPWLTFWVTSFKNRFVCRWNFCSPVFLVKLLFTCFFGIQRAFGCCVEGHGLARTIGEGRMVGLDDLWVFSNLSDSMILWFYELHTLFQELWCLHFKYMTNLAAQTSESPHASDLLLLFIPCSLFLSYLQASTRLCVSGHL